MREVILTVGQRASGKSTFCEKAMTVDPSMTLISRDQILIELFGKTSLDPYTGEHFIAQEMMWESLKDNLSSSVDIRILLDAWNGSPEDRTEIIWGLRELGVERIVAWYFVTSMAQVEEWFWKKPGIAKISEMKTRQGEGLSFYLEESPREDYRLFHRLAENINSNGFDEVVRINPLVVEPQHLLKLQTSLEF